MSWMYPIGDKQKRIRQTDNGSLSTESEITGKNVTEIKTLTARVMEETYNFGVADYGILIIQNLSKFSPIEFILDGTFDLPNQHITPTSQTNIQRLEPGQTMKVRSSPSSISYRSKAGRVDFKVICGQDAEISRLENKSPFENIETTRYQVIAVDRMSNTLYAHAATGGLYKSEDSGKTWSRPNYLTDEVLDNGFLTKDGTLLVTTISDNLYRSTDGGETLTLLGAYKSWRQFDTIAQNSETGTIVFGENPDGGTSISLYRSTDDGATWTNVLDRAGSIRHWHSVQVDPYTSDWIATSGDLDSQVEWWRSSDDGVTWEAIVGGPSTVTGNQMYRTLGLFFTQEEYVWASDNPLWGYNENFVLRVPKDNTGTLTKGMSLPAAGYAHSQIGEAWLLGTIPEGATTIDRMARLYISKDGGQRWDKILDWRVRDGQPKGGFSSISPTDQDGNQYIRLFHVDGYSESPWYYGTLKVKL